MKPLLKLTTDDFKRWEVTLDGDSRTFWRDGNWHMTDRDGEVRLGSKTMHWSGAARRAVEQIQENENE